MLVLVLVLVIVIVIKSNAGGATHTKSAKGTRDLDKSNFVTVVIVVRNEKVEQPSVFSACSR